MTIKHRLIQNFIRAAALLFALQLFIVPSVANAAAPPVSTCNSYLLADATTGDILFANKPNERIYPASTTKIMTALVLLENESDLSKTVTVGSERDQVASDASIMGLKKGEIISLKDLLYGLLLPSGADAAHTIAVDVGGTVSLFVDKMNAKAAQLKMTGTRFVNPDGMHDDNHYSTAADLAKLSIAALSNPTFRSVVSTYSYKTAATNKHPNGISLTNADKLISTKSADEKYHYQYAIGVKTGYTDEAHGCLVAAAQKDGQTYVAVLLGDSSSGMNKRFTDAASFFEFGFTQKRIDLYAKIKATKLSTILPGGKQPTNLSAVVKETSIVHWLDANIVSELSDSTTALDVAYAFAAQSPVPTGSNAVIGTVTYSYKGTTLYTCDIIKTPVETPLGMTSAAIKLVSAILMSMGLLLIVLLILRRISATRHRHKRYGRNNRSSGRRLRDPHDYR